MAEQKKKSRIFKGISIGCGALLFWFIVIGVIVTIFSSGNPVFDKVKSPTNQSTVTLSASNAYKNAKVELYQDGNKTQDIKSDSKGKFTAKVDLKEGNNKFKANSTTEKGKTKTSLEINVVYDKTPPILVLGQTKIETGSDKAEISGETENNSTLTLLVNDKEIGKTLAKGGKFKFNVKELKSGENKFIIKVIDEAGNVGEQKEVVVVYTPPTEAPKATETPKPVETKTEEPTPTEGVKEAVDNKDLILNCMGGDKVVLWDKPTDLAGGARAKGSVPCGTIAFAENKFYNEKFKITFYDVTINDKRVKTGFFEGYGWVTEDLITWR